jgi:hypothetical protein
MSKETNLTPHPELSSVVGPLIRVDEVNLLKRWFNRKKLRAAGIAPQKIDRIVYNAYTRSGRFR